MRAFGVILRHPGALVMSGAALVGRFPIAMLGLALTLLVVEQTGSYAWAGAVAALLTVGGAVGGPIGSRLADRHGQDRVLPPLVGLHVMAVGVLTVSVLAGWPATTWLLLAFAAGLVLPNFGAMVRARWASLVADDDQRTTAFALEATLDEFVFVLGPVVVTALAVGVAPWSAVAASVLLTVAGGLVFAGQRRTQPSPAPAGLRTIGGIWGSRPFRVLVVLLAAMGMVFGALDVSTIAFARERGVPGATGVLLALFALASGATGLYLGARPGLLPLRTQLLVGTAALAAATAVLPLVAAVPAYAAGMFAAGLGVSAVLIGAMQLIEAAVPATRLTEALALGIAGIQLGFAAAAAISGALIDRWGPSAGLAVGAAAAASGLLLVLLVGRRLVATLTPVVPAEPPGPSAAGTAPPG
jgi:MFS family permease